MRARYPRPLDDGAKTTPNYKRPPVPSATGPPAALLSRGILQEVLAKVRKKDREPLAQALKTIWRADTVEQAHRALRALEEKWTGKYPKLVAKWVNKS